jgi:hypothetical protein
VRTNGTASGARHGRPVRPGGLGPGTIAPRRPGHRVLRLMPLRNRVSTSALRYLGLPSSLRTSGSRPRRAQVATAAEVTPNKNATSAAGHQVLTHAVAVLAVEDLGAAGRGTSAVRPGRRRRHHVHRGSLVDRKELIKGQRRSSRGGPGQARYDTDVLGAGCTENAAANCSERHRSADRYSTTLPLPREAGRATRPPDARRRYHDRKVYRLRRLR